MIKEALANGRLTNANQNQDGVLSSRVAGIRKLAEQRGSAIESLALAAALARPWAGVVLSGAAAVGQIQRSVAAGNLSYDARLDQELRPVAMTSADYWRARNSFTWN